MKGHFPQQQVHDPEQVTAWYRANSIKTRADTLLSRIEQGAYDKVGQVGLEVIEDLQEIRSSLEKLSPGVTDQWPSLSPLAAQSRKEGVSFLGVVLSGLAGVMGVVLFMSWEGIPPEIAPLLGAAAGAVLVYILAR